VGWGGVLRAVGVVLALVLLQGSRVKNGSRVVRGWFEGGRGTVVEGWYVAGAPPIEAADAHLAGVNVGHDTDVAVAVQGHLALSGGWGWEVRVAVVGGLGD